MRITESMASLDVLRNLETNFRTRLEFQKKLASGRKLNVPSDNPAHAVIAYRMHSEARRAEQYTKNAIQAKAWLNTQDSAMAQVTDAVQRARVLAVEGASDTISSQERQYIANEVRQLFEHVVQIANTKFGDRYIFGGSRTKNAPFLPDGTYVGDKSTLMCDVAQGVSVPLGLDGGAVFEPVFSALKELENALISGDAGAISSTVGIIDASLDNFLSYRAEVGAKYNRVDAADRMTESGSYTVQKLLSEAEDADLPLVATQLSMAEVGYRAALKAGSYLVRVSLLDYLK